MLRRNRRHLRYTAEPPPSNTTETDLETDLEEIKPEAASTAQRPQQAEESTPGEAYVTTRGRAIKRPARFQDYDLQ